MKDLFIKFLKENKLYFRFKAYFSMSSYHKGETFEQYLDRKDPFHYVTGAFGWPDTDEGKDFWEKVDNNWDDCREKHAEWKYTITFKSNKLEDAELIRDVAKLLKEKYGVTVEGNLKTRSDRIS